MADKKFGVKQIDLIGASGTPNLTSPNNLNLNAVTVAISTDVTIGGQVTSNIIVGTGKSIGIGTTVPTGDLDVRGQTNLSNLNVSGVSTFAGITTVTGPTLFSKQLNVSGVSTFTGNVSFGTSAYFGDNSSLYFGNDNDLRIFYDGSFSRIWETGDFGLDIRTNQFFLSNQAGTESLIVATENAGVELYYDNSKKFETIGAGATVTGTTFTNQLSVSGVSTFNSTLNGVYLNNAANVRDTSNIAIGEGALLNHTNGDNSIAIGYRALYTASNINFNNIGIGYQAGYLVSNGVLNTFLGYKSGYDMLGGSGNVIIGSFDGNAYGLDIRNADDYIILSANGQTSTQPRLVIDPNGNTGIGTTNPTQKLEVSGSVKVGIDTSQGVILTSPNGTKYQLFVENDGTLKTVAI
jgi:hypothetical protein